MITAAVPQFCGFLTDFNRTRKKKKERYKNFLLLPLDGGKGAAGRKTVIKSAADCCQGIRGTCLDTVVFYFLMHIF